MAKDVAVKKQRLPKHKRRSEENKMGKKSADPLKVAGDAKSKYNRNFSQDLQAYLNSWKVTRDNERNEVKQEDILPWKFNKILQAWALDNCFDKKKIDTLMFKELLPYIITIKGGAIDRLATRAQDILDGTYSATKTEDKNDRETEDAEMGQPATENGEKAIAKSMLTRAKVIDQLLTELSSRS